MAVLIPDVPKECTYSERLVYERLGRELPDDWVILHSLGLHDHDTKIWGEADIVVLSTRGFFALEVKGGSVDCRDGVWYYGQPGRGGYKKNEDPWTQSKDTMFAISKLLRDADPAFDHILFGYGVVMPMETFTATGPEIEQAVLLDHRHFTSHLGRYVAQLELHWRAAWQATGRRTPMVPTPAQVRRARQILRPDVESTFSIGGYLTAVDSRLLQLTNEQIRASRRMSANHRTVVRGRAGTGKTVLAIERARELSEQGLRVLFLCFNQLLAAHIRKGLSSDVRAQRVEVRHVHSYYADLISKAGLTERLDACSPEDPEFFSRVFPSTFVEAVLTIEPECWDALVVDEAQDIMTLDNLDALDLILRDGLIRGRWHFFLDPLQDIYGIDVNEQVAHRLEPIYPAYDDLFENCRNTREVATQASIVSGIDLALHGAPDGPPCESVFYGSRGDFIEKLDETVAALVRRDVPPEHIAILSTRKQQNSLLNGRTSVGGLLLANVTDGVQPSGSILYATMHAFKGLERPVVLAIDMEEIGDQRFAMLHYAGLSRACGLLRTFIPRTAKPSYQEQAKAYSLRRSEIN